MDFALNIRGIIGIRSAGVHVQYLESNNLRLNYMEVITDRIFSLPPLQNCFKRYCNKQLQQLY